MGRSYPTLHFPMERPFSGHREGRLSVGACDRETSVLPLHKGRRPLDLNQLYFDHQVSLIQAQGAATPEVRQGHESAALRIAKRIGSEQRRLGAGASCAWLAQAMAKAA